MTASVKVRGIVWFCGFLLFPYFIKFLQIKTSFLLPSIVCISCQRNFRSLYFRVFNNYLHGLRKLCYAESDGEKTRRTLTSSMHSLKLMVLCMCLSVLQILIRASKWAHLFLKKIKALYWLWTRRVLHSMANTNSQENILNAWKWNSAKWIIEQDHTHNQWPLFQFSLTM